MQASPALLGLERPVPRDSTDRCSSCGSQLVQNETEMFCSSCGLVVDSAPIELRRSAASLRQSFGPVPQRHGSSNIGHGGLSWRRGPYRPDLTGSQIGPTHKNEWYRRQDSALPPLTNNLNIPRSVIDRARRIGTEMASRGSLRGHPISLVIGVCTVRACREMNQPISLPEVAKATGQTPERLTRAFIAYSRAARLPFLPDVSSVTYLHRFLREREAPTIQQEVALRVLNQHIETHPNLFNSPRVRAVIALTYAFLTRPGPHPIPRGGQPSDLAQIERWSGITRMTLRINLRKLSRLTGDGAEWSWRP